MFYFEPIKFVENLKYMGIGMLGIFIIVGIIILATHLIGYTCRKIAERNQNDEE